MELSRTELQIIGNVARGVSRPKELAKALKKSPQQKGLSRTIKSDN